ncbi:MAG: Shedu anti-phage system protein SduA domain-containing protein, partial [Verrucomicrobiia bacterium]
MRERDPDCVRWDYLNKQVRRYINSVLKKWEKLLDDEKDELDYHEFLRQHAGLFFGDHHTHIVISKVRLGGEYTTDFVAGYGRASNGFIYQLIEIETPQAAPFTKAGQPSERLTHALQQVDDWDKWLTLNPEETRKIFPAARYNPSKYTRYTIIIGRRGNSKRWLDKRNQLSQNRGVAIRSFDHLTDRLRDRHFYSHASFGTAQGDKLPDHVANRLENPFYEAFSEKQWRRLLRENSYHDGHFVEKNANILIEARNY